MSKDRYLSAHRHFITTCLIGGLAGCGGAGTTSTNAPQSVAAFSAASASFTPGQVLSAPQLEMSATAQQLNDYLSTQSSPSNGVPTQAMLQAAGTPVCGVNSYYVPFTTQDDNGANVTVSEAVMLPTGTDPLCTGPRPILLLAHGRLAYGTGSDSYNIAQIVDPPNSTLQSGNYDSTGVGTGLVYAAGNNLSLGLAQEVVSMFVAQGYIVIAPNYAGSDTNNLTNLVNQHNAVSGATPWPAPFTKYDIGYNDAAYERQMLDALTAGKASFPGSYSSKLFVAGSSYGGYIAMAALKALDAAGTPATAGLAVAGNYTPAAISDLGVAGITPGIPFTGLTPASYCVYQTTPTATCISTSFLSSVVYTSAGNANTATNLFQNGPVTLEASTGDPQRDQLIQNQLDLYAPNSASNPTGYASIDPKYFTTSASNSYAVNNSYRFSYLRDATANPDGVFNPSGKAKPAQSPQDLIRQALVKNDMRSYTPSMPLLLCDGGQDLDPAYINTLMLTSAIVNSGSTVQIAQLDADPNSNSDGAQLGALFGYTTAEVNNNTTNINNIVSAYLTNVPNSYGSFGLSGYGSVGLSPQVNATMSTATTNAQALYSSLLNQYGLQNYHGYMIFLPCFAAARTMFSQY